MRRLIFFVLVCLMVSCGGSKNVPTFSREVIKENGERDTLRAKPDTRNQVVPQEGNSNLRNHQEFVSSLQLKYADLIGTQPTALRDDLVSFIDQWRGVPYFWGGESKTGIDCSAFVQKLCTNVYNVNLPRNSFQQFKSKNVSVFSGKEFLQTGDLIFFKTLPGDPVTHVGLYLDNNFFVNSNYSSGVDLDSLTDPFWKKRIIAYGRLVKDQ